MRIFGTEGVLMIDVERERMSLTATTDSASTSIFRRATASTSASCRPPLHRPHHRCEHREQSDADVAARSVELIDALLRSSAAGGAEVRVHDDDRENP